MILAEQCLTPGPVVEVGNDNVVWAATELRDLDLGAQRLNRRAVVLVSSLLSRPDQSLPQACGGQWPATKATTGSLPRRCLPPAAVDVRCPFAARMWRPAWKLAPTGVVRVWRLPCYAGACC